MAKASAKKRWFTLVAPKLLQEKELGQTLAYDPKGVIGKTMKTNLSTITGDIKRQNSEIKLIVKDIQGDKAVTSIIGYKLLPASLKRNVRKGRTRIDEVIRAVTKDEQVVTIKIVVVTQNVIQGSVKTAFHNEIKRIWLKKIAQNNYDYIVEQVVSGRLYKEMKDKLKKLYPLRLFEVLAFKLERFAKASDLRKIKSEIAKFNKKPIPVEELEEPIEEEQEEVQKEEAQESKSKNASIAHQSKKKIIHYNFSKNKTNAKSSKAQNILK